MRGALRDHPNLPFQGSTPLSVQCSYEGAKQAQESAQVQLWAYLRALRVRADRGLTDYEASALLNIRQTSICARRNWLMARGFVKDSGHTRPGPTGVKNTVWIAA